MKTLILTGIVIILGIISLKNLVDHFRGKGRGCSGCSHDKKDGCNCGCDFNEKENIK